MYRYFIYFCYLISIFIAGCRKEDKNSIETCDDNCFLLSDLRTKTNHLLPFILYNDINSGLKKICLNGRDLDLEYGHSYEFTNSGFYKLILVHTGDETENDTILLTTVTEEREAAEWGIEEWTPARFTAQKLILEEIECIYPRHYVNDIDVPFLFFVKENDSIKTVYSEASCAQTQQQFYIKRGVGSIMLNSEVFDGPVVFNAGGHIKTYEVLQSTTTAMELEGDLAENVNIPVNSIVHIGDLHILSGASLTINAGTVVVIDEAANIVNDSPVIFNGDPENPVLVTCSESGKYWGGFISNGTGATITANYTFFCRSGYHNTGEYAYWGHAQCQALFYTNESTLNLGHCYILDNKGQIFYPQQSQLNFESILVQRAKTGGQINYCTVSVSNSIFTDFPDDSQVYRDEDNDALYINASDVTIDHSTFMFAKDDGMDSGLNEGGTVTVKNSWFEACFHEGAALSSQNDVVKNHNFSNCTFINCGQGLELGFSSPNHAVTADHCRFLNNGVGIRYGDNYDWSIVNGYIYIQNSQSLDNGKDVWNMVRMLWAPRLDHLQFENTQVSAYSEQYPDLDIITR
jgi:hypothetical protein